MSPKQIGNEFENKVFNFLNKKFDKVEWLSKSSGKASLDFKCIKKENYGIKRMGKGEI